MAKESRFQLDLIIAVSALLISTLAALASVYQSRLIASQLSAAVWPYLSVHTSYLGNGRVVVALSNDGAGPALIRAASATFYGKPIRSWNEVLQRFISDAKGRHTKSAHFGASGIDPASIVRSGDRIELLRLEALGDNRLVVNEIKRLRLHLCYCSILNRCWTMDSEEEDQPPQDTARCPANEAINATPLND